jgi:hypothetical protein
MSGLVIESSFPLFRLLGIGRQSVEVSRQKGEDNHCLVPEGGLPVCELTSDFTGITRYQKIVYLDRDRATSQLVRAEFTQGRIVQILPAEADEPPLGVLDMNSPEFDAWLNYR